MKDSGELSTMGRQEFRRAVGSGEESPLRIGLLTDEISASKCIYDFGQWAQSQTSLTITHFIVFERPKKSMRQAIAQARLRGLSAIAAYIAFSLVTKIELMLLKKNKRFSKYLIQSDLSDLGAEKVTIVPTVMIAPNEFGFDDAEIRKVKDLKLDLLLRCGEFKLQGAIVNSARFGTLAVQLGDTRSNRRRPAGFWEVYRREDMTGFSIQHLRDGVDFGDVLMEGRLATRHYYLLNQTFVSMKAGFYLKKIVAIIAATRSMPKPISEGPYSHISRDAISVHHVAMYFLKLCFHLLEKKVRALLGVQYRWTVAYVFQDWRDAELNLGIELENRPFHYLADPFVISRNGKDYCFVEDFNYVTGRGVIDVYELAPTGGILLGTALKEDFHLSFPYLFEYQGQLYMCPESSESRDIRIYRCAEFPLKWELEEVVMDRLSAVDTMIFQRDGKWWMFTNIDPAEIGDHCSELYIFSSRSPIGGTWTPHGSNPILVDASCARNAGCLVDGDDFYRLAQRQGFDFYGKSALINKVVVLSDIMYVENCVSAITPSYKPYLVGTHHLHSNGRVTVFDLCRSSRIVSGEGNLSR